MIFVYVGGALVCAMVALSTYRDIARKETAMPRFLRVTGWALVVFSALGFIAELSAAVWL